MGKQQHYFLLVSCHSHNLKKTKNLIFHHPLIYAKVVESEASTPRRRDSQNNFQRGPIPMASEELQLNRSQFSVAYIYSNKDRYKNNKVPSVNNND